MYYATRFFLIEHLLTDAELDIGQFILNSPDFVVKHSIQNLAKKLYTHPTTIVRFCKKLDYMGFSDLKAQLRLEKQEKKLLQTSSKEKNLLELSHYITDKTLQHVAHKLARASRIHFFGVGDNLALCEIAAKQIRCTNKRCYYYQHRHDMLYAIQYMKKTDLLFFVSMSGETAPLIELAQLAKKTHAFILTLTNRSANTLAKLADFPIYCYAPTMYFHDYDVTNRTFAMATLRKIVETYWDLL